MFKFQTVAESYFTNQRLKFFNDTVNELYPEVKILNPRSIDFVPLQQEIARLDQEVTGQKRQVEYIAEAGSQWKEEAENTLKGMYKLEEEVIEEIQLVNDIVAEIQSLASNIQLGAGAKVEYALQVAEDILKKMKGVSFQEFRDKASDKEFESKILIYEMTEYTSPVKNLTSEISSLNSGIKNLSMKIDDLHNIVNVAEEVVRNAAKLNEENRRAVETGNIDTVKLFAEETNEDILAGRKLNHNASDALKVARPTFKQLGKDFQI